MENMNNYLGMAEVDLRATLTGVCDPIARTGEEGPLSMCLQAVGEGLMFYTGHDLARSRDICTELPILSQWDCFRGAEVEAETNKPSDL